MGLGPKMGFIRVSPLQKKNERAVNVLAGLVAACRVNRCARCCEEHGLSFATVHGSGHMAGALGGLGEVGSTAEGFDGFVWDGDELQKNPTTRGRALIVPSFVETIYLDRDSSVGQFVMALVMGIQG